MVFALHRILICFPCQGSWMLPFFVQSRPFGTHRGLPIDLVGFGIVRNWRLPICSFTLVYLLFFGNL